LAFTPPHQGLPFSDIAFATDSELVAHVGDHALTLDLDTGDVSPRTATSPPREYLSWRFGIFDALPVREVPSPDGHHLLANPDFTIVLRSTADGRELPLTDDGNDQDRWRVDVVDPVIILFTPGLALTNWSPDGSRIAAYRDDFSGVSQLQEVHNLKRT